MAQLIVERIASEEAILVENLENTERGTKGFGSNDRELTKQVDTCPNLLTKSSTQEKSALKETIPLQAGTGPDLLTQQSWGVTGPAEQHKKNNRPQGKIYISEITQKEFRKAYKNGETLGVVKFSQKEKQIYLRRINISTELAIRDKEEQRTMTRRTEDSLEYLVPKEYHDQLPNFEKGEKTSLPPHSPGIDLEIHMEEGKGLPDHKICPHGAEELETVQDDIRKNEARGWIREAFTNGGSPIMFVEKKDGSLRLCVDYRALNEVTRKDRYRLPLIGEAIDRLPMAKYFAKRDIKEPYHNVRIRK